MERRLESFFVLSLVFVFFCGSVGFGKVKDASELIKKIETQYQGETSHGTMKMVVQNKNWKRTLVMESWSAGRDKFLARILDPKKERGTCTLKVEDNIWNYLPKIDRLMKIPSSLMGDKWMGSHLTNDDLVKENKIDKLYDFSVLTEDEKKAVVQGLPKPDAPVVWGKILYTVDMEKEVPISVEYFDEDGEKVRVMTFSDVEKIQDRWIPRLFRITPLNEPNEFTELVYEKIEFDLKIPNDVFSTQSLRKM